MDWAKTAARRDENHLSFGYLVRLILEILWYIQYAPYIQNINNSNNIAK